MVMVPRSLVVWLLNYGFAYSLTRPFVSSVDLSSVRIVSKANETGLN